MSRDWPILTNVHSSRCSNPNLPCNGTAARPPTADRPGPRRRLAVLREQVAVGAARGVGEVLFAIGVTTEASVAGGAGRIAVTRVAAVAGLVLGLRVKARQLAHLVTAAAGGRLG